MSLSLSSCWPCNVSSSSWLSALQCSENAQIKTSATGWLTWSPIELSLIAKKEKVEVKSKPSTRSRLINCSNACTPSLLGPLHKTRWSGKEKNRQQKRTEKTQEDTRRGISEKTREHEHVESWTTTMPMHLSWRKPINSKKKRKENEEKGQKKKAKIKIRKHRKNCECYPGLTDCLSQTLLPTYYLC